MDIVLERILSLIPRKPDGKYLHGAKKAFCESIGAPTNIISEWETGKTRSYRNYLYQIAAQYDVSVAWLRGESEQKKDPAVPGEVSPAKQALLNMIDGMSDEQLAKLLPIVREAQKLL